jgi:hypothetical protein
MTSTDNNDLQPYEDLHNGSNEMLGAFAQLKEALDGQPALLELANKAHVGAAHWGWAMEKVGAADVRKNNIVVDPADVRDRHQAMVGNLTEAALHRAKGGLTNLINAELDEARASGFKLCLQGLAIYDPSQVPEDLRS